MFATSSVQRSHINPQDHHTFSSATTSSSCTFCDIWIARAVPTFSALGFELSFRRQWRVSIQLASRSGFSVARLLVATKGWAMDVSHLSSSSSRGKSLCSCAVRTQLSVHTETQVHHQCRQFQCSACSPHCSVEFDSPDDREITAGVLVPAKIGFRPSIKWVHPELFRVTGQAAQPAPLSPTILAGMGCRGSHTQQSWRWEAVPGEPCQCFVCVDRRLRHWFSDFLARELNVWSDQCNEQVSHASALEASGLVSWQVGSCKRVLRQERGFVPRCCLPLALPVFKPIVTKQEVHVSWVSFICDHLGTSCLWWSPGEYTVQDTDTHVVFVICWN